jgi:hypothetical protein
VGLEVGVAASAGTEPFPADTEERIAGSTTLVATAIASAQPRSELRSLAVERPVAALVARASPSEIFIVGRRHR